MTNFEASDKIFVNTESVDWGAILMGASITVALSSIMLAFGTAVGLSLTSFADRSSSSIMGFIAAAALWLLWVQVSSFAAGGYMAGRLRRRSQTMPMHESELHDGSHGLAVWAVAVVFAAALAGLLASTGTRGVVPSVDISYYADQLVASDAVKMVTPKLDTSSVQRILAKVSSNGVLSDDDKTALSNAVTASSGIGPTEAQGRVDTIVATLKSQAKTVRNIGILLALLTATSFLVGAVAAWWSAVAGAKHRYSSIDHSHLTNWR